MMTRRGAPPDAEPDLMMLINTYLAPSRIPGAGLGVFCTDFVREGTTVWDFVAGFDYVVDTLPDHPVLRDYVIKYGYVPLEGPRRWIMCADNGRFFNNNDDPTCLDTAEVTVAGHDLMPGTELTSDYRAFCRDPFAGFEV